MSCCLILHRIILFSNFLVAGSFHIFEIIQIINYHLVVIHAFFWGTVVHIRVFGAVLAKLFITHHAQFDERVFLFSGQADLLFKELSVLSFLDRSSPSDKSISIPRDSSPHLHHSLTSPYRLCLDTYSPVHDLAPTMPIKPAPAGPAPMPTEIVMHAPVQPDPPIVQVKPHRLHPPLSPITRCSLWLGLGSLSQDI